MSGSDVRRGKPARFVQTAGKEEIWAANLVIAVATRSIAGMRGDNESYKTSGVRPHRGKMWEQIKKEMGEERVLDLQSLELEDSLYR